MNERPAVDVLNEHRQSLYTYAVKHMRDPALAEDLVQETLLAALGARDRFAGKSAVRTWLTGILKHKIADALRQRARAPVSLDALCEHEPAAEGGLLDSERDVRGGAFGDVSLSVIEPEAAEARRRFWDACQRLLNRMPAQAAHAFMLSEVLGHDSDEVCRVLGISAANLWTTLHRARKTLRTALGDLRPA